MVYLTMGWIVVVVLLIPVRAAGQDAPAYNQPRDTSGTLQQLKLQWTSGFV